MIHVGDIFDFWTVEFLQHISKISEYSKSEIDCIKLA